MAQAAGPNDGSQKLRLPRKDIAVTVALLLAAGSIASCSRHHASLPPDVSVSSSRIQSVPSAARIRGSVPTTVVQVPVPAQTVSNSTGDNPWEPQASPRDWQYIVLHHTASDSGSVESINETHLDRGWEGVGYHFVIGNGDGMGDGEIEETFRWREQMHGAHAGKKLYNQHGIGIVLIGNFQETAPSPAQLSSVKRLVATLKQEYGIPTDHVIPHKDVKATECPGKNFPFAEVAASVSLDYRLGQSIQEQPRQQLAGRTRSSMR